MKKDLGDKSVQVATIGPAAENHVLYAGIFANLARLAARTGMGTVMASKNLKAMALKGTDNVGIADPKGFWKIVEEIEDETYVHPQYWPRSISKLLERRHFASSLRTDLDLRLHRSNGAYVQAITSLGINLADA